MRHRFGRPILAILITTFLTGIAGAQSNVCPEVEIKMPARISQINEKTTVVLAVSGGFDFKVEWSVSSGIIVDGQGTTAIVVVPSELDEGRAIEATAKITGLPEDCKNSYSESFGVESLPPWCSIDEVGKMPKNDLRGRLDLYFAELNNNPSSIGWIDVYFAKADSRKHKLDHLSTIVKHSAFRKFDLSRIRFSITDGLKTQSTKFWRYQPDAHLPKELRDRSLINGKDLLSEAKTLLK